jgi:hypothetical protein
MLKIRKVHILVRHLFNQKDHSVGIFFKEKNGGIDCLWTTIEETVLKRAVFNMRNFMKNPTHHLLVAEIYGV